MNSLIQQGKILYWGTSEWSCDEIMAAHSELISITFHGVPPGMDKVYTMFAGSFPIGECFICSTTRS